MRTGLRIRGVDVLRRTSGPTPRLWPFMSIGWACSECLLLWFGWRVMELRKTRQICRKPHVLDLVSLLASSSFQARLFHFTFSRPKKRDTR